MRAIFRYALSIGTLLVVGCGAQNSDYTDDELGAKSEPIYGGSNLTNNRLVVKVQYGSGIASGIVISRDSVLTAGHLFGADLDNVTVAIWRKTNSTDASEVCLTPASGGGCGLNADVDVPGGAGIVNDLSVVRFDTAFAATAGLTANDVWGMEEGGSFSAHVGNYYGYGATSTTSSNLRWAYAQTVYDPTGFIKETDDSRSSCGGDSGGPLVAISTSGFPRYVYGVTVTGQAVCNNGGGDSGFAPVKNHIPFIRDIVSAARCTSTTHTAQTPPPQATKKIMKCW